MTEELQPTPSDDAGAPAPSTEEAAPAQAVRFQIPQDVEDELMVGAPISMNWKEPEVPAPDGPAGEGNEWLAGLDAEQVLRWYHHDPRVLATSYRAEYAWRQLADRALTDEGCRFVRRFVRTFNERMPISKEYIEALRKAKLGAGSRCGLETGAWFFTRMCDQVVHGVLRAQGDPEAKEYPVPMVRVQVGEDLANLYGSFVLAGLSEEWRSSGFLRDDAMQFELILSALAAAEGSGLAVYHLPE